MKKEEAYYLGKIVKKYGLKGELLAKIDTDDAESYKNLESIYLETRGKLIPFFLNKTSLHKATTLRFDFEDVHSMEDADALIGKSIYLPLNTLPELTGNKFYYHEVIGYQAIDQKLGEIGVITAVNDYGPQAVFVIKNKNEKEILIPVSDRFIQKVNRKDKNITFETPEGLIDIYL